MAARQMAILETVTRDGKASVAALAKALSVSQVTIRKDLDALEEQGLVRRERGIATPVSSDDPASRIAHHYAAKLRIARAAADSVSEGETVMIEAGSCCSLLAGEIARTKRSCTIVTNSAFIAEHIRRQPHASTILLGGNYQNDSQVMVGPMIRQAVSQFLVDKLFIGTDGFSPRVGFTGRDQLRTEAVRTMAEHAEHVIILTESDKFGSHGPVPLLEASAVTRVWTDAAITEQMIEELTTAGVNVSTVAPDGTINNHAARTPLPQALEAGRQDSGGPGLRAEA